MTDDAADIRALLVEASEAHDTYEKAELDGVYDQDWAQWYATYVIEHGLSLLLRHAVTVPQLADFLAETNLDYQRVDRESDSDWATYTSRRLASEL
jgi:hypothetical protein